MNVTQVGEIHNCDCGFSWRTGKSGSHECGYGLRKQLADLKALSDALAAENAMLKSGIGFFSYGTDSGFEEHDSAEKAIAAADSDIDYYRGDACDGWSEETDQTVWGVILQRATMIDERPRTEEDSYLGSHIASICDYALLPNMATPATDAYLNSVRAEGVDYVAEAIGAKCAELKVGSKDWKALKSIVFTLGDFAAKIRAGKDGE
ncbi:hypothetical protein [Pantoea vagans]|uniref:hypothetical protein n=1 Tax=Pantoea vagans TaxID=470934 RepID=UPI00241CB2AC|nr:hypothetical protein [Pantoea vagans]